MLYIGLDVGFTTVKMVVMDESRALLYKNTAAITLT